MEQNKITEDRYHELLQKLNSDQDKNEDLIKDMVKWYMNIDFDHLDDLNRRISDAIINGRLLEADSLLNSLGDPDELEKAIRRQQAAEAQEAEALAQRQANLEMAVTATQRQLEDLAQNYLNRHNICLLRHNLDSAVYWLERKAMLDTNNAEWQKGAGSFIVERTGDLDKALKLFNRVLSIWKKDFGEEHPEVAKAYYEIADIYYKRENHDKALDFLNKAITIQEKILDKEHPDLALSYNKIGNVYDDLNDYDKALDYYTKALTINEKILVLSLRDSRNP